MMEFEDKVNDIIGKKYDSESFHCYSLVEYLVPYAPKLEGTAKSLSCGLSHFKSELSQHKLKKITEFKDKDLMVLGRNGIMFHIGVYYQDGVIHNTESDGVIYQSMATIKSLYSNIEGLRV